jgi:hypothetical protein
MELKEGENEDVGWINLAPLEVCFVPFRTWLHKMWEFL